MLRILHITTVAPTLIFLRGHVAFQRAQGCWVAVASAPDKSLDDFAKTYGVAGFPVRMERRITPLRDLLSILQLLQVMRRTRPHIVHAHTPKGGLLGMIAARLARVPVCIYHLHGLPLETARGHRRLLLWLSERVSCALAHQVLAVSRSLREVAVRRRLVAARRVLVPAGGSIAGVDAAQRFNPALRPPGAREQTRARLGLPARACVLGYVGRVVRDKGLVELAQAWEALREASPHAHLLLVGATEPQDPVPPQVLRRLEADPRVHRLPFTWEIVPLYAAMDLLVLPSYREGFPVVVLEAAAMALPVVTTEATGCVDSVEDGVTGRIVPVGDAVALARALGPYLAQPALRRAHGAAARERVLRQFRPERVWSATLEVYRTLLLRAGVPAGPLSAGSRVPAAPRREVTEVPVRA